MMIAIKIAQCLKQALETMPRFHYYGDSILSLFLKLALILRLLTVISTNVSVILLNFDCVLKISVFSPSPEKSLYAILFVSPGGE